MAKFDYARMQHTATRLLDRFQQGTVQLKRVTTADPDPATPWVPGVETVTMYPLTATVKRIDQRYENGVLIVETGDQVTFPVLAVEPVMSDVLIIDGAERAITSLRRVPAAGTVVAWKAFCKA